MKKATSAPKKNEITEITVGAAFSWIIGIASLLMGIRVLYVGVSY
jgi:hypothetical protein